MLNGINRRIAGLEGEGESQSKMMGDATQNEIKKYPRETDKNKSSKECVRVQETTDGSQNQSQAGDNEHDAETCSL